MELRYVWDIYTLCGSHVFFTTAFGLVFVLWPICSNQYVLVILWVVDVLQDYTVLALLGIVMLAFGGTKHNCYYRYSALFPSPVVRNTYVGLENIDPAIKRSGKRYGK